MNVLKYVFVISTVLLILSLSLTPVKAAERCGGKRLPTLCKLGKRNANFTVRNSQGLRSALRKVRRGGVIQIRDGVYRGSFKLSKRGSASKPIVVRGDRGAVFKDVVFKLSGKYGVLMGVTFDNGQVEISGDYNRVTRNRFIRGKRGCSRCKRHSAVSVERGGRYNRIDHNEITNWKRRGFRINRMTRRTRCNRIDHNYVHDVTGRFSNGQEVFQIGTGLRDIVYSPKTYIQYNLVDNYNLEYEIVSLKSNENVVSKNTFLDAPISSITVSSTI